MRIKTLIGVIALCTVSAAAKRGPPGPRPQRQPRLLRGLLRHHPRHHLAANANLALTTTFGVSGINAQGRMEWATATAWIAAMNSANYLGISSWRLPEMYDIGNDGCTVNSLASYNGGDCGYNVVSTGPQAAEMASLFYDTLGNLAYYTTSGTPNPACVGCPKWQNTAPISNLGVSNFYWYGQETTTDSTGIDYGLPAYFAWYFGPSGAQRPQDKEGSFYNAWAVVDGDVPSSGAGRGLAVRFGAGSAGPGPPPGLTCWMRRSADRRATMVAPGGRSYGLQPAFMPR
jgi:hypothetical protein